MFDIFHCALVWVVEDIINSNLTEIDDTLTTYLATTIYKKQQQKTIS